MNDKLAGAPMKGARNCCNSSNIHTSSNLDLFASHKTRLNYKRVESLSPLIMKDSGGRWTFLNHFFLFISVLRRGKLIKFGISGLCDGSDMHSLFWACWTICNQHLHSHLRETKFKNQKLKLPFFQLDYYVNSWGSLHRLQFRVHRKIAAQIAYQN